MEEWYVLRIVCGKEELALSICQKIFSQCEIINPKRRINWRKNGRIISIIRPLFEGYLFVSIKRENIKEFDQLLRRHSMRIGWLVYSAGSLMPIFSEERQLIQKLMGNDGIVEISEVEKTADQIKIVKGPLLGLEQIVKKYSRRDRRITIEVPILQETKQIELGGILIEPR